MTEVSGSAPDPEGTSVGLNLNNFEEYEAQMEDLFDKADHLMIHLKKHADAVSINFSNIMTLPYRKQFIHKSWKWTQTILMQLIALLFVLRI